MTLSAEQTFETIPVDTLVSRVQTLREQKYRLVQIGATTLPNGLELTYTFERDQGLVNLRFLLPEVGAPVPSITSLYWGAFLYENELHDLFHVNVQGIAVDFHGELYQTAVKFPFGSTKPPVIKLQSTTTAAHAAEG